LDQTLHPQWVAIMRKGPEGRRFFHLPLLLPLLDDSMWLLLSTTSSAGFNPSTVVLLGSLQDPKGPGAQAVVDLIKYYN